MKIRENCYMLGLGSTGGKIYKEFVQRHYKGAAANGSEQDHKALGDVPKGSVIVWQTAKQQLVSISQTLLEKR